jgi:YesN/AraC family two-component response regulator
MEHGGVDIMDYVHTMLREQVSLKDIAKSFGVTHPQHLK